MSMYYTHFGLRGDPFRFTASALFLSAAHREGLAALEWGVREPSGLTLVVGEVGTGKTTLIHALLAHHSGGVRAVQLSNPTLTFEEMLRIIVRRLGIHPAGRDKVASLHALETFLADPVMTDRVVLIFDEAQGLSDEALEDLRLLSNYRARGLNALQIILVGQPELAQRLTAPRLRALDQRIGARAVLRPLQDAEVRDYVDYLVRAQGARRAIFSRPALVRIVDLSSGLPRKINNLCRNSMLIAYSEGSRLVKPRHVEEAGKEIENMLDFGNQANQAASVEGQRIQRGIGKSKPFLVAGLSVLAIAAFALVFGFENGRIGMWVLQGGGAIKDRQRSAAQSSKFVSGSPGQSAAEARNASGSAAPPLSGSAYAVAGPPAQPPIAPAAEPGAPKMRPASAGGAQINPATRSRAHMPATGPASDEKLTAAKQRKLGYEIRRAKASLRAGRYANATYHLRRAIALAPANPELRELLRHAREAQSERVQSAPGEEDVASASAEDDDETTNTDSGTAASTEYDDSDSTVVRDEVAEGDAYMRAGNYGGALHKFRTALALDPGNEDLSDRIERAEKAKALEEWLR
jgi:general secretion pathway protein A